MKKTLAVVVISFAVLAVVTLSPGLFNLSGLILRTADALKQGAPDVYKDWTVLNIFLLLCLLVGLAVVIGTTCAMLMGGGSRRGGQGWKRARLYTFAEIMFMGATQIRAQLNNFFEEASVEGKPSRASQASFREMAAMMSRGSLLWTNSPANVTIPREFASDDSVVHLLSQASRVRDLLKEWVSDPANDLALEPMEAIRRAADGAKKLLQQLDALLSSVHELQMARGLQQDQGT